MLAMNVSYPARIKGHGSQINDPQVSQACSQHQAEDPRRVADVAAIQLKSPTFLVGKERFNVGAFTIPITAA